MCRVRERRSAALDGSRDPLGRVRSTAEGGMREANLIIEIVRLAETLAARNPRSRIRAP
jgi:hypothetical protein